MSIDGAPERFLGVLPVELARVHPAHGGMRLGQQRIELQSLDSRRPHNRVRLVERTASRWTARLIDMTRRRSRAPHTRERTPDPCR